MKTNGDSRFAAWQIQEQDFPNKGNSADKLEFLLRYAILAPSGHNTQPWKFSVGEDEIQIFADKTRWLRLADSRQVAMHISIGCTLENLLIAAEHFGYGHQVTYFPKPDQEDLVAAVQFMPQGQPSSFREPALLGAIPARHTNRKVYEEHPISKSDLGRLQSCCVEEGIWLHLISDLEIKRKVKEWLIHGHATMLADPAFRRESAYWVGQGIFNMPRLAAKLVQLVSPYVNPSRAIAIMDSRLVMSAPVLAILSSTVNDRESQVKVGQVFERICLMATTLGICMQPMSPLVDVPELKVQVAKLLPNPDVVPQHAFRLGYAQQVKAPAPRRPFSEVLT